MREILFRGKHLDTGGWVEGAFSMKDCDSPFGELVDRPSIIKYEDPCSGFWFRVDPGTVGQFTGLTDKNGKKIFEGDIVHYVYEPGKGFWNGNQNGVIKWREPGWYMEGIKGTNKYALMSGYMTTIPYASIGNEQKNIQVFEVIGNIHDNPELLEG